MNIKIAKDFLRQHQPMPNDFEITEEEGNIYSSIISFLEKEEEPPKELIPLLINSISENTGLGMYEHINFIFLKFNKSTLLPYLKDGLLNGNNGVIYRCIWWAIEVNAWELWEVIQPLINHVNEDVSEAAVTFSELMNEN